MDGRVRESDNGKAKEFSSNQPINARAGLMAKSRATLIFVAAPVRVLTNRLFDVAGPPDYCVGVGFSPTFSIPPGREATKSFLPLLRTRYLIAMYIELVHFITMMFLARLRPRISK